MTLMTIQPPAWHAERVTNETTQEDLQEIYDLTVSDGNATVVFYKLGSGPGLILMVQVMPDGQQALPSVQLYLGDLVYFDGTNFSTLTPASKYVPYAEVYGSPEA